MTPKIDFVRSCATCRFREYHSKGRDFCSRNGRLLPNPDDVRDFYPYSCPLPNYPDFDELDRKSRKLKEELTAAQKRVRELEFELASKMAGKEV